MNAKAETAAESLSFGTAEIPKQAGGAGRPAEPNPFVAKIGQMTEEVGPDGKTPEGKAATLVVPVDDVKKRVGQAQRAGRELGVTVRVSVDKGDSEATLTLWIVPKIVRPRGPKQDAE